MIFMWITAAVLAEICSALPLSGSIYVWAAESAGPKYARFFGFIVAWWSCTAWMTFAAGNCQVGSSHRRNIVIHSCGFLDYSKLYCLSACCLGRQLPWWRWQRQYSMACPYLGRLGRCLALRGGNQLPSPKMVFHCIPTFRCALHGGLPSLRHLAPHRCI